MDIWIFDGDEFQDWLRHRNPHAGIEPVGAEVRATCAGCGTRRDDVTYFDGSVCGYCLAYEFGVDSQERLTCSVVTGLLRTLSEDAPDRNQRLLRQLVSDAGATLAARA